ncbi:sensor histidine kinase [Micromonospora sp. NPDC002389]|uniref:sensor histidine kinase n=1 Tax=Micromonospora sp. NPDC002389 TaxID=3154272 RepID=UPI0033197BBC
MTYRRWVGEATTRLSLVVADLAVAVAVVAAGVLMRPPGAGLVAGVAAGCVGLPLALRRAAPVPVLVAVTAAGAAALVVGLRPEAVIWAVAYALYPVALAGGRSAVIGLAGALTGVLLVGVLDAVSTRLPLYGETEPGVESFGSTPVTAIGYALVVIVGAWALGRWVGARRWYAAQLAEARTRQAVAEERLRLAREVHDVVGHNLSLIAMKAAVANHVGADREATLQTIETISRTALDDVRAVLDDGHDDLPDLAGLDALVAQARAAGLQVVVDRGDLSAVPAGVQASAYRIVQEALTNVRRHADARRCRIAVTADAGVLRVEVVDDGAAGQPSVVPGRGLTGMRDRVAGHGGVFAAGPEPAGGFGVRATLPFAA